MTIFRTEKKGRMRYGGEPVASSVALTAPPGCRTKPQSFTMTPRRLAPSPSPATLPRVHLAAAAPRCSWNVSSMFLPKGIDTCCSFWLESSEVGSSQVPQLLVLWVSAQTLPPSRAFIVHLIRRPELSGADLSLGTFHHWSRFC